jgi:hypothetical protein
MQVVQAGGVRRLVCRSGYQGLVGILQGILGRVRDGTANHPDAANMAPRVLGLAEMSWAYA